VESVPNQVVSVEDLRRQALEAELTRIGQALATLQVLPRPNTAALWLVE